MPIKLFQRNIIVPSDNPPAASSHTASRSNGHLHVPTSPGISPNSSQPSLSSTSLTPTSTRPTDSHSRPPPPNAALENGRVRSRLHALFNPTATATATPGENGAPSTRCFDREQRLERVKTEPPSIGVDVIQPEDPMQSASDEVKPFRDRDAIKILIVTWNMGDALPKGDLAVLLGEVPAYDGAHPTGSIPELTAEHKHPYHIVVVAGQECPTHSGVPRGWGGGFMKGVRGAHRKHKEERQKEGEKMAEGDKAAEGDKTAEEDTQDGSDEKDNGDTGATSDQKDDQVAGLGLGMRRDESKSTSVENHSELAEKEKSTDDGHLKSPSPKFTDEEEKKRGVSPSPSVERSHTTLLHRHVHPPSSKGWSQMLDDWFCGPSAVRPSNQSPQDPSQTHPNPSPVPAGTNLSAPPVQMLRSVSAPGIPSAPLAASVPLATSPTEGTERLAVPQLSRSPLSRSISSEGSTDSSSSTISISRPMLTSSPKAYPIPAPINIPGRSRTTSAAPLPSLSIDSGDAPQIAVEEGRTVGGEKCYLHLIKERLMGMYLSVYVYKGCEHLIQGVDKDFVTAGLAGGRVGNKGGIGISLKLADHRFLFVNSHLAAHTARLNARMANIAKIKSELRLDTFLPKDDPLQELEDLTDRFDTVFWCGDLNFRLDLSRLHAEWLVEKKKYSEALMWDQLRNAMKEEKGNPFPGFQEHVIDFPPTFKYDVWHSLKTTNKELRKTIRRRGNTISSKRSVKSTSHEEGSAPTPIREDLPHVPEGDGVEENENCAFSDVQSMISRRDSDDDSRTMHSRRSFESSLHSAVPSTAGTDMSDGESMHQTVDASAYGSRHKALEVKLKTKTKRLLGLVKMDGVFASPSRRKGHRHLQMKEERTSIEFDATSRRTSMSSVATALTQESEHDTREKSAEAPTTNGGLKPEPIPVAAPSPNRLRSATLSTSVSTSGAMSPPRTGGLKRMPSLRRTPSFKFGRSREDDEDELEIDEIDRREGRYDTSKKQRVPSWCDRVLWKTKVIPDPEEERLDTPEPDMDHLYPDSERRVSKPFNRLSQAFVNFGGHLRLPTHRAVTLEPTMADRQSFPRAMRSRQNSIEPPEFHDNPSLTPLVTSPEGSPSPPQTDTISPLSHTPTGMIPAPRRALPAQQVQQAVASSSKSPISPTHPLLGSSALKPKASPPADPRMTFEPAVRRGNQGRRHDRKRANSDSISSPAHVQFDPTTLLNGRDHRGANDEKDEGAPTTTVTQSATDVNGGSKEGHAPQPVRRMSFPRRRSNPRRGSGQGVDHAENGEPPSAAVRRGSRGSLRMRARTRTLDSTTSAGGGGGAGSKHSPIDALRHSIASTTSSGTLGSHRERDRERDRDRNGAFFHPETASEVNGVHGGGGTGTTAGDDNAFVRFFRDIQTLPTWLHRNSQAGPAVVPVTETGVALRKEEKQKRHERGQVVCLHYGTIDDAGMRLLEGRSDHRPAIFSAAVYTGD